MTQGRLVGPVDRMWLDMDRPENLMVIEAVMWFDAPVDWGRLAAVVEERMVGRYPVFRQRPGRSWLRLGFPVWEDDPEFDLGRHLVPAVLPAPGDEACLQRYIEAQMSRRLRRDRPLWELHLVDGYRRGAAVVARFHHSLADGLALAEVLLSLTDATAADDAERAARGRRRGPAPPRRSPVARVTRLASPARVLDAVTLARQTVQIADKLLLGTTPDTPLTGRPGVDKRAVWSGARSVSDVKQIGRLASATVNDVVMSAVSAAFSTYLVDHGGDAVDLTTMVPVDLRPGGKPLPRELGNEFALVLLPLPTAMWTPLGRLAETKRRMDAIKRSPEATITFGLINAIGLTPPTVERALVDFFSGKAVGVTTDVIAPSRERFVAGSRIAGMLAWVPGSGRQTVGVCTVTYAQTVRVGFKVDAACIPDPERLVDAFDLELDRLMHIARAA